MSYQYFNPFENIHLNTQTCFLTGTDLTDADPQITVFPDWILDRFSLREKKFKMMGQVSSVLYGDLNLPCSAAVAQSINELEYEIQSAFTKGYDALLTVPTERLFLWIGKMVYGILYHDLIIEKTRQQKQEKEFRLSPHLKKRFGLFHLMLQSLISPVTFAGTKPWSISIVKLKYSKDIFNYRDSPINLIFTLGMNGFGLIACLQDNGLVKQKHKDILDKIKDTELHPVQFEELCARFFYSNYLFHYQPQYRIEQNDKELIIESVPEEGKDQILFGKWDADLFAQVLAEHWEPWGLAKKDIITFPDDPVSFLENEYTGELISPDTIKLPF